ncbi:MAG: hypothetical protein HKN50_12815 [Gammaproteobacteria bacterium]|nr:hypothetical protein [Gammaproteobacteria bacterium]
MKKIIVIVFLATQLSGCLGTAVGLVVDTAIEVAKVPFKVAGAVIDVAMPDGDKKKKSEPQSQPDEDRADRSGENASEASEASDGNDAIQ